MKMSLRVLALAALAATLPLHAQTYTGSGAAIPDDGNVLQIPLVVSGLPFVLDTVSYGLETVCFTIEHTWISDLDIRLVAPDGTSALLVTGQGGASDDFANTCLNANAATAITSAGPPYTGTFRAQGQLGVANNGQNGNGTWYLRVYDTYPFADEGDVITWSITFGNDPAGYFTLQSSDLPLVIIDTEDQTIPDGTKITCGMGIVDNGPGGPNHPTDPFNGYSGRIGIELRGSSSLNLSPKKSYSVELRDADGNDLDSALLGMSSDSDWILSANYFDKSFLNNALTYHLARQLGRYAPRTRHVEVLINGEYQGVYVLIERIKRGAERVDIAKLTQQDIAGDDLSGGYILSVDRNEGASEGFISDFPPAVSGNGQETYLHYRYPKGDDILPVQASYIQAYVDAFETALDGPQFLDPFTGYRTFADASSFVDLFLLNELSRNVDGYRLSSFLYKDKDSNGGLLNAGPAWDYDIAWGNADYCQGSDIDGWAYSDFGAVCGGDGNQVPFWWARLQEDPQYVEDVRCRWEEVRGTVLSPPNIDHFCDSVAALLSNAQVHNFTVWPTLGQYVWPNPSPIPTTYAGEVAELKDWAIARWSWLDANLPGVCTAGVREEAMHRAPVFPDPFVDHVWIDGLGANTRLLRLLDAGGREVHRQVGGFAGTGPQRVELPAALAPGLYVLHLVAADGTVRTHRVQH